MKPPAWNEMIAMYGDGLIGLRMSKIGAQVIPRVPVQLDDMAVFVVRGP